MTDAPIDEEQKNRIGQELTLRLARAIKEKEISVIEAPLISKFILENIDKIQNHEELNKFLTKLTDDWPFFANILELELGKEKELFEKDKIEEIQRLIHANKIDEALDKADELV